MGKQSLSIVIPVFNEEANIHKLYESLHAVAGALDLTAEIIFVDDGSSDNTFGLIRELAARDPRVKGLSFSRNFGHQMALYAGMEQASGEWILTMDGDMQHPPDLIPRLLKAAREGADIVNTTRISTRGAGLFKNLSSSLFYRLMGWLSDLDLPAGSADFRLMSNKAAEAFLSMPERNRFTRGMIRWMGFRQTWVPYEAQERYAGTTKYSTRKMFRFALDAITSFSPKPLRLSFYLGLISFLSGLAYGAYAVVRHYQGDTMPGWTSLLLVILLLGGVQLLSLGVIGEYISRIYIEAKKRPPFIVRETTDNLRKHEE